MEFTPADWCTADLTLSCMRSLLCLKDRPELTPVAIRAGKLLARRLFDNSKEHMDYHAVWLSAWNYYISYSLFINVPSVLWRCWLGGRKGIRPVKNWVVGCWRGYLSGARCRLACGQLMPLPLTVFCFSKIQIGYTFLVPAQLGSPGKGPLNGCVRIHLCDVVFGLLWRCWLGGRKGIRPVKNWVVGCWCGYLSGARCRLAYGPADATATHCLLLQ